MSEDDVVKGEEKKLRDSQWHKLSRAIGAEWQRAGYQPYAHLRAITGQGDMEILKDYYHRDVDRGAKPALASVLARWDLVELLESVKGRHWSQKTVGAG